MRWPFMLRATHEAIITALHDNTRRREHDVQAEHLRHHQQYDRLMDDYRALRLQHHEAPAPAVAPTPPAEPDAVAQAIVMSAGSNLQLRRALGRYASEQRILGMDEDAIAKQILVWEEDIEWEPSV